MSLDHAILGFLTYTPLSGYDLKKMFDASVQHFWPADQSQIYRTLARMEESGYVRMEVVEQQNRPDRKVYHITEEGREELRKWLLIPAFNSEVRHSGLVQVFFSGLMSDEEAVKNLEDAADKLRAVLSVYHEVPEAIEPYKQYGTERDHFYWLLTLEMGQVSMKTSLAWVESVIRRIKAKDYRLELQAREEDRQEREVEREIKRTSRTGRHKNTR